MSAFIFSLFLFFISAKPPLRFVLHRKLKPSTELIVKFIKTTLQYCSLDGLTTLAAPTVQWEKL